jgi:hypothetical protein
MEILKQMKNLKLVDNAYEGTINLPCWIGYDLPDDKPFTGEVRIIIGQSYTEQPYVITEADAKAIEYLLANAEAQQQAILTELAVKYPKWQLDYGYSPQDAAQFMPDITSMDDFKKLIVLANIHILPIAQNGSSYFGYEFNAQWDVEHGMGCMFHEGRIVDFGMAESSFVLWKAQNDLDAQTPKPPSNIVFDKARVQAELYQFTVKGFKTYVAEKAGIKDIYALAYDFDTVYNMVHLSLNSLEDHGTTMSEYKDLSYMKDKLTTEEGLKEVKYGPGNFRHCAFDTFNPLNEQEKAAWEALYVADETPENSEKREENRVALYEAITETLAFYARGEEVKLLPITSDFYFIAVSYGESVVEAEARIQPYV